MMRKSIPPRCKVRASAGATRCHLAIAGLLLVLATAPPVLAQVDLWVPELPLMHDSGTAARPLGMGGAYLAISDDAAALRFNPAGLARVSRVEFYGSLTDVDRDIKTKSAAVVREGSLARTKVSALGFVYPFPTYRGSMVIALGYSVPWIVDREYRRYHTLGGNPATEEIYDEGGVGEWSFGYAVDVSPTLSLGLRATYISGSWLRDSRWLQDGTVASQLTTDFDVHGYTASLGALTRVGSQAQLALVIDLPRWIRWDPVETSVEEVIEYAREEITMPFSAAAGAAVTHRRLLLTADARYTDWTQIDYKGPMRYRDEYGMHDAYRRTLDLHVGAEYLVDLGATGLRVRAGFASEPVPYRILLQDIDLADDPIDDEPIYARASFSPQRTYFTLGAGALLAQSMTIDVAYADGSFARKVWDLREEYDERRVLLTAAFRLN